MLKVINKEKFCIDCKRPCSNLAIRCKACSNANISRTYTKTHGKTTVKSFCIDCRKQLSKNAYYYGYIRCKSCNIKFRFINPKHHPMFGKHHLEETKRKISESEKGKIISLKQRILHSTLWSLNKNPKWNNGSSFQKYPKKFTEIKSKIRERDKKLCRFCGKTEIQNGKQLDVHHIDYNKTNNNINNLISLCMKCHRHVDRDKNLFKSACEILNGDINFQYVLEYYNLKKETQ